MDSIAANQPSPQHRAVEGTAGLTQALTLEVDTDYYEALEGSEFDWQALARSRTGTRVHWADSVVSPEKRRNIASTESWHDENAAVDELEEYSSWQISLGIANERAALTGPVRLTAKIDTPNHRLLLRSVPRWRVWTHPLLTAVYLFVCRDSRRLTNSRHGSSA
jgi:hypothetical protein